MVSVSINFAQLKQRKNPVSLLLVSFFSVFQTFVPCKTGPRWSNKSVGLKTASPLGGTACLDHPTHTSSTLNHPDNYLAGRRYPLHLTIRLHWTSGDMTSGR